MTIEEYRNTPEGEITYPTNGAGLQMPQLIDDLWNARKRLIDMRTKTQYSVYQCGCLIDSIAFLNRALTQLGIELKSHE